MLLYPVLAAQATTRPIEFNRDVRPILSDKCYSCHGADAVAKKIPLRLDSEAAAKADLGGRHAIVEGDPTASQMIQRITSPNKANRMPPVYSGLKLTDAEIAVLRNWVMEGAKWQKHWAFIPPVRPDLPAVKNAAWVRNPIDAFVLAKLEREALAPSPEAARETLLRRVSLDLTGLPPSIAEMDAFLKISRPKLTKKRWTDSWPRRVTESGWPPAGSTPPGTPIPTAISSTAIA